MSSNTEDLTELKATQTIELLRSGRLKPSVSVEFYLDRIAQYNAIVNALCYVSERTSRTRASQLEQQIERSQEALLYGLTSLPNHTLL